MREAESGYAVISENLAENADYNTNTRYNGKKPLSIDIILYRLGLRINLLAAQLARPHFRHRRQ